MMVPSHTDEGDKSLEDLLAAACASQQALVRVPLIPGRTPDRKTSQETAGREGDAR